MQWLTLLAFGWDVSACLGSSAVTGHSQRDTHWYQFCFSQSGLAWLCVWMVFVRVPSHLGLLLNQVTGSEYCKGTVVHKKQLHTLHYEHHFVPIILPGKNVNSFCHFCKIHHIWEKINFSWRLLNHPCGWSWGWGFLLPFSIWVTSFNMTHLPSTIAVDVLSRNFIWRKKNQN